MTQTRVPLGLYLAMAVPGWALAQQQPPADTVTLPAIKVQGKAAPNEATEGTGSYTTEAARTATPLGLSLRDTPQSVSVMTQQRIQDEGLKTITDVVGNVTGLAVHQYETNRAQFTARGFDINTLMIDGVPTTWDQAWSSGEVFTSLAVYDRVEVVRGATGLTTGAGDPSAAVNLVRKRATSKALAGSAEVGLGSWNARRAMADVSTPLNEARTVRARVVGEYAAGDSSVDVLTRKNTTLFATLEADLTPDTLLTAGVTRQETDPHGAMWGGLPVWYADGTRTHWDRSKTTSADWVRWNTVYENEFASLEQRLGNGWRVKASYSHGDRQADSYLLYLFGAPDRTTGLGLSTFPGSYRVRTKQDDFALQAGGLFRLLGRTHELALGYTYSKQDFHADSRDGGAGGAAPDFNAWDGSYPAPSWGPLSYYGKARTRQDAVYAAARFDLADPLRLILGARVTNYEKSGDDIFSTPYAFKFHGQKTPYAGLVYDLGSDVSAYASYTDIFQPQIYRDINGRYLDPVLGKSGELGLKGAFLEGRLNASAAVFRVRQDNLAQSTGATIPGTTPPETAYVATQGATSKGFEFEVSGDLAAGWHASAGYSQFSLRDAGGQDVNTIYPRKLLRLFTTYTLPGAWNRLTVGGGVNWESSSHTLAENPLGAMERIEQNGFALVNLMLRYQLTDRLSAQLNIDNAFDKTYFRMFDAFSQMTYGEPRNVTLTAKYTF